MSLKPRHYLLIALIVGIFAFNLFRRHRVPMPAEAPAPVITTHAAPVQTAAWTAFDHAASLRDAPNNIFDPSMQSLQKQLDVTSHDPALATTTADLDGCLTWLQFYRQGVNHPSKDTSWKDRSQRHLNGCVEYHLDTTAP